jgi:hypothetical protein
MFEGYHSTGGFQDGDREHLRLRVDQNLDAAQYSLVHVDRLYRHWQAETEPASRSKLVDAIRREFSFMHAFYRQARADLEEIDPDPWTRSPLRSRAGEFKNILDDLTLQLEMDKVVPYAYGLGSLPDHLY